MARCAVVDDHCASLCLFHRAVLIRRAQLFAGEAFVEHCELGECSLVPAMAVVVAIVCVCVCVCVCVYSVQDV